MAEEQKHKPFQRVADAVLSLAKRHGITYVPTARDDWARDVTRLADDDVTLDDIELLLVELQRTGYLSHREALGLQAEYLHEDKR